MLRTVLPMLIATTMAGAAEVADPDAGGAGQPDVMDPGALRFDPLDRDGDGRISPIEVQAGRRQFDQAVSECRATAIPTLDADGDGRLSRIEAGEGKGRVGSLVQRARVLARAAHDRDGDGMVALAEAPQMASALRELVARTEGMADISEEEAVASLRTVVNGSGSLFSLCDRDHDDQLGLTEARLLFDLIWVVASR